MSGQNKPFIHEKAEVQTTHIGDGTKVWEFSIILQSAQTGSNCIVNAQCFIENNVVIENNITRKCSVQL